jgi:hypothetical protein
MVIIIHLEKKGENDYKRFFSDEKFMLFGKNVQN